MAMIVYQIHPRKLTWNLKIPPWKGRNIYKPRIFGFYVKFRGCILYSPYPPVQDFLRQMYDGDGSQVEIRYLGESYVEYTTLVGKPTFQPTQHTPTCITRW